jgi:CheY-like chemotaxis protein
MTCAAGRVPCARKRILVADDDLFYREIATTTLEEAGFEVESAANGSEALALVRRTAIDLAVVDVEMPTMGGLQFLENVRAAPGAHHLPVIIIAGNDDTESIAKAYDAGATSFLAKPLNWPLFVQHVQFVLKSATAESDLRDAMRTAEFMSDLKSRVVSVMMSEFQAPLRVAQGMTELLRKEVFGPLGNRMYTEYTEDLHKALEQLSATQLKLLTSMRVGTADLLIQEELVAFADCLGDAIRSIQSKAERRGIDIVLRTPASSDIRLRCDRALFSQAIKMLLESSVQFAPRNSVITVDTTIDPRDGLSITVTDDAPSLPEGVVREILNIAPAQRQDLPQPIMTRNTGLTISRVLAEAHDGRLALRSISGEGNVARLTLPSSRLTGDAQHADAREQRLPRAIQAAAMARA